MSWGVPVWGYRPGKKYGDTDLGKNHDWTTILITNLDVFDPIFIAARVHIDAEAAALTHDLENLHPTPALPCILPNQHVVAATVHAHRPVDLCLSSRLARWQSSAVGAVGKTVSLVHCTIKCWKNAARGFGESGTDGAFG